MYEIQEKTYKEILNKLNFLVANLEKGIETKQVPFSQRGLVKLEIRNTKKLINKLKE